MWAELNGKEGCPSGAERTGESNFELQAAIRCMDAWLDTMRGPEGYGGPVVHWWQDCLDFGGAGMDWRYEGILAGYLNLYRASGNTWWLKKARRAGDDLVRAQLPSGNFPRSNFEANPKPGGTPHEAACDLGLLELASELAQQGDSQWRNYLQCAERNLTSHLCGALWEEAKGYFRDSAREATFVPNKVATAVSALFAWMALSGDAVTLERFILPSLDKIVSCQVRAPGHRLDGAIDQAWRGKQGSGRYHPFYIARCIPALVEGHDYTGERGYLRAARAAMRFILRTGLPDGSFPQVIYRNGQVNRYPQWISGTGDTLRAMEIMKVQGMEIETEVTLGWMLAGLQPSGGMRTGRGFGSAVSQRSPEMPEFRDLLTVCGWADKAFRYLTSQVEGNLSTQLTAIRGYESDCTFRGRRMRYREDGRAIECWEGEELRYRWRKGADWAEVNLR